MQESSTPVLKDLVLLGGGHSHVAVLKRFGMEPLAGVRLTLVSRDVDTPYSGMLPGLIAGHYTHDEAHIDLGVLARFAGARFILGEAIGLDPASRLVHCRNRPPIPYDVLSINIGATPSLAVPGAARGVVPVKPISGFLAHWEAMAGRVVAADERLRIAVVGGGVGGVELLLSVQYRLRTLLEERRRSDTHLEFHLFSGTPTILPHLNGRVQRSLRRILERRGVRVHTASRIVEVDPRRLRTADNVVHEVDEVLWTTEAAAAPWLAESGIAVDPLGFVRVTETLQSLSHAEIFAAGDVASMSDPRPKSGVFAVRQGPYLADNLRRALLDRALRRYRPQRHFLSLISTGDRYAVASRRWWSVEGRWVWRLKDRIDRRFMRKYQDLPAMAAAEAPHVPRGLADEHAIAELSSMAMRCGGCGAKVGAPVLGRALEGVRPLNRADVLIGLDAPDDAAVVAVPPGKLMVHSVDFFRSMLDDPFVFAQIATTHCLGDVYAMGAEPQTALAMVTIPYGIERQVEATLTQLMAGAAEVLREAGAALVGGHTGEGAELGLGFAVNGLVDRDRLMRKGALRPGDRLILTKPIGTGTLFAADMRHQARGRWITAAVTSMLQSNRAASESLFAHGARACTDVTGFGLIGHLVEMLRASQTDAELDFESVPLLDGAEATVRAGILSSLQPQNLRLRRAVADAEVAAGNPRLALLFDPQTAGGLLAGVPDERADACLAALRRLGYPQAAIVGRVLPRGTQAELVRLRAGQGSGGKGWESNPPETSNASHRI